MEVFVRVVETGSFSGAARLLRVGQPAVSKAIAQLEERLGVSLLLRLSRGITSTEAGQNFYERAKRAIEEADEAELAARDAGNGLAGRLRFSSGVTFGRLHIIPRLPLFLAAHPEITVEAILDDRDIDLVEEGIDAGFRMGVLADTAMVARKIGQSRRVVLGTPAYFEKAGEPPTPAKLADHQAVTCDSCPVKGRSTWSFRSSTSAIHFHLRRRAQEPFTAPATFDAASRKLAIFWKKPVTDPIRAAIAFMSLVSPRSVFSAAVISSDFSAATAACPNIATRCVMS
jgi:DNA-binding transcriptional LysR family regulator